MIINARDVVPYGEIVPAERKLAENLVFNVHPNALSELISYFQTKKASDGVGISASPKVELDKNWSASKKCHYKIVNRIKEGLEEDVVAAISENIPHKNEMRLKYNEDNETKKSKLILVAPKAIAHDAAVQTLNEVLLPAMKEVGDKFGAGELILPFVLKSAECMKAAVLEQSPCARFVPLAAPPAVGGVLLGMQAAGVDFRPIRERLIAETFSVYHHS